MGMYTKLHVEGEIHGDYRTDETLAVLRWMIGEGERPDSLPDHPLFFCDRAEHMLKCNSFYHIPMATHRLKKIQGSWYFMFNCDLKNYEAEIEKFLDWIAPRTCDAYGFTRYEEYLLASTFRIDDGKLTWNRYTGDPVSCH